MGHKHFRLKQIAYFVFGTEGRFWKDLLPNWLRMSQCYAHATHGQALYPSKYWVGDLWIKRCLDFFLTQIFSHKLENNETQKLKTLKVNSHDAVGQEACVQLRIRIRWINHISLLLAKLASMFVLY